MGFSTAAVAKLDGFDGDNTRNMIDIANLMINDKQTLQEPQQFESPERTNISEYDDDVFSKMMTINDSSNQQNLFQEHKNGLQEKQDVDVDDFFSGISMHNKEELVDVTELHQVLNRRSR